MSKTTYVCRRKENTALIKCVCALCELEKSRAHNAALQAALEKYASGTEQFECGNCSASLGTFFLAQRARDALSAQPGDALEAVREAQAVLKWASKYATELNESTGGVNLRTLVDQTLAQLSKCFGEGK